MLKYLVLAVALLAGLSTATRVFADDLPSIRFIGVIDVPHSDSRIGGLSGLSMSADGKSFTAISDRGSFVTGTLIREGRAITELRVNDVSTMKTPAHLRGKRPKMDTEGLAKGPDGKLYVSLEGPAEVWVFDTSSAKPSTLTTHPDFANMPDNGALEALAILPDGTLLTMAEGGVRDADFTKLYRYRDERWDVFADLPRSPTYLPVGADFGPDGKLYVLHREFSLLAGFRSELARYAVTPLGLGPPEHLWGSRSREHGNLEGLSVWRDATGDLRFTMVSDDNFQALFKGQLVEYALTE